MFTTGTIIEYQGHTGPIKHVNDYAITFTISNIDDKMREVNMVVYNHSFDQITFPDSK